MTKPAPLAPAPAPEQFALDRHRLQRALDTDHHDGLGTREGFISFGKHGLASEICGAVRFAQQFDAIKTPPGIALACLASSEGCQCVLLMLGTDPSTQPNRPVRRGAYLPPRRQVTSGAILATRLTGGSAPDPASSEELMLTLEEACREANELLPTLHLLEQAESDLIERTERPVTELSIGEGARTHLRRVSASELFAERPSRAGELWVLLIAAIESGEGRADYDGTLQRNYLVEERDRCHLAQQLLAAKPALIAQQHVDAEELYPPDGGFERYLDDERSERGSAGG
jgi:hypothetical protein